MLRRFALLGLAASAIAACNPQSGPRKSGPAVARGNGITITADEFKARLDEQSPFIRARYTTLDRKKEFLDSLVRFEVLAREAERQGLANDPDVQLTMKKIMVQKLVQKSFQADAAGAQIPDADLQAYYDQHKADYYRPKKLRVAAVIFNAPEGSADRAKKKDLAKKALAKLKVEEKKNTLAFTQIVNEFSEDPASKATAGDLNFKSQDELEKGYGKELADALFALKPGDTSPVVETKQGFYIAKITGLQDELNRSFDQVKAQIANKLSREKKTKEFDEYLKKLKDQAAIQVDDKVLEGVEVAAAPAGAPGMMGGMPGMPGMPGHGMGGGQPMVMPSQQPQPAAPAAK